MNGGPPLVMDVTLVEDIGRAADDADRAADLRVVDVGVADVEDARQIVMGIIDDMDLHAADAPVPLRPGTQLAKWDGRRIDEAQQRARWDAIPAPTRTGR